MHEQASSFGTWLRRQRLAMDLTQLELAEQVACSIVTVRKLERDELRPSKQLAERLVQALNIPPAQQAALLAFARGVGPAPQPDDAPSHAATHATSRAFTHQAGSVTTRVAALPLRQQNLPAPTTPLVGREQELAELQQLLAQPDVRLVTILGAGGMGKSHLAQELAWRERARTQAGVFFVALAAVTDAEGMILAIIDALGYPLQPDGRSPKQQLLDYLDRKQMLLVLDNFEHLLTAAALVNTMLGLALGVKIVVTSRAPLQLSGETHFVLRSLAYPAETSATDALDYAAVILFMARARRLQPTFTPGADEQNAIVRICRLVEGMPLGILLAASWIPLLSAQTIADEITRNLDFLEAELRDLPERHHSLRAVFTQSWQQLADMERTVFMRLAVFRRGFTRQAAQTVAGASPQTLRVLVNQSLLHVEQGERYTLHELLRQYAAAELTAAQQSAATRERHCAYYLDWLAQRAGELAGPRQADTMTEIDKDYENVRCAWEWAVVHANSEQIVQAQECLGFFYEWRGRFQEGESVFAQAAESLGQGKQSTESHILVRLLIWQAKFRQVLGNYDGAKQLLHQAEAHLTTSERMGHDMRAERAVMLYRLGQIANEGGEPQIARPLYEQSLALFQALGDAHGEAGVLLDLGRLSRDYFVGGAPQQHWQQTVAAKQMALASVAIYRVAGDRAHLARGLWILGSTCLVLGEADEAQIALEECLAICQALGTISTSLILAMVFLAGVKQNLGLYGQMRSHGETALDLAQAVGDTIGIVLSYAVIGRAALAENKYVEARDRLQQSIDMANRKGRTVGLNLTLVNLGLASYRLGDTVGAARHLCAALRIGLATYDIRGNMHGLLLGALLLAEQGKLVLAVEMHALAICYPFVANSRWCEDVAGRELAASAAALPDEIAAAARARGRASDIWFAAAALLDELATAC